MAGCNYCTNGCYRCVPGYGNYQRTNAALKNFSLSDPIAEECQDPKQLNNWFRKSEYVPYAGYRHDSQHTVLRFIDNLALLSPTLGGVINSIYYNCFGGKMDIVKVMDTDFDFGDERTELPRNEKLNFLNWIKTFDLSGRDWSELKSSLFRSLKSNGNAWLEVKIMQSMGAYKVMFKFHSTKNVLYKVPTLFIEKIVAISRSWDTKYLKENPPQEVPVYPLFSKEKDGTIRTMIHYKQGENEFYGRPDWWPCSFDAFLEIKNKEYLLKAAHNNFTGKVLIEFADDLGNNTATDDEDAKKEGFTNAHDRWIKNFTDQGDDPTSVLVSSRPAAATPAFVHEFNINTNHDYYKTVDMIATDKIIVTNGWSRKLMGLDSATGLSTTAYLDELKTKMPLIENFQSIIDNDILNKAIRFVAEQTGKLEFAETGIESKNPFDHLIKAQEESNEPKPITNVADNNK